MYYSDVLKDLSLRLTASRTRLVSEPQLPQKIPHLTSYSRTFDHAPIFRRPGLLSICEVLARQLNHRYDRIRGKRYRVSTSVKWLLALLLRRAIRAPIRFQ